MLRLSTARSGFVPASQCSPTGERQASYCGRQRADASPTIALRPGEVWSVMAQPGTRFTCASGTLWLTQSSDAHDYILVAGQSWVAARCGKVVVQALNPASMRVGGMICRLDKFPLLSRLSLKSLSRLRAKL